jgi:hypothetical protein
MVDRAMWVPEFHFTDEQKRALRLALSDSGDQAERFIALVESRTRIFLAERANLREHPIQRPKALLQSLTELDQLADRLYARINDLDPLGDESLIVHMLALMKQPEEFLEDLQQQLGTLRVAALAALERVPEPSGGRPAQDHEIGFIAEIAVDYERLLGQLPPAWRGSWFCGFIDSLFSILPDADEDEMPDHYRLAEAALGRIKAVREQNPPFEESGSPEDAT